MVRPGVSRKHRGPDADAPETARSLGSTVGVTVEEVWTYCSLADFRKHKSGLVHLAEWVATKADQEAVAIVVDSGMELVVGKETS